MYMYNMYNLIIEQYLRKDSVYSYDKTLPLAFQPVYLEANYWFITQDHTLPITCCAVHQINLVSLIFIARIMISYVPELIQAIT